MAEFDDIIKSTQWAENIHKSVGLSSQISEMLKTQGRMANGFVELNTFTQFAKSFQQQEKSIRNLSAISMMTELAKSMQHQEQFTKNLGSISVLTDFAKSMQQQHMAIGPSLSAIDGLTKSMRFAIPQTTLDAITSINTQHNQLFGNLKSITEAFTKNQTAFSQINNWQFAFSSISGQLASVVATQRKWDLIDDFESITEDAVSLNERIFDENGVTNEGLNELKIFLQSIEIKVDKIETDANSLFWKLLTIIGFILAVMSEARVWLPKPEYATKQEVETVIKEQIAIYAKKLKVEKEFRIVQRVCKVMAKPNLKSLLIERLPIDFEVTVLQINKKWVYVSYHSPTDNLPQTGWIMKKYLVKPVK
ncbi:MULTISPECIES: hypothetical protein [unclassified Arcicella]|uniref:hypothetical protein n=1 Tax=unclassified Arcicella TaxID=2644986 RepID=UPI00285B8B7B|nr:MULTISPECIES: hypothetical protein [unclassified Arcicella]MDR6564252.1 hypothetical protein [Arcicella sp. BE51]MDR6811501.1 hypothetical protein [Arcicella sp. BE140]MDR6823027.1 hypothetical protein [Arcicella sp. BE139]